MDIEELQKQIRDLQKRLDWTDKKLADVLYVGLNDIDDTEESSKFRENMRKHLRRHSTPASKLEQYLEIIKDHPDFKKLDIVRDSYIPTEQVLSKRVLDGMRKISKDLDKQLTEKNYSQNYDKDS